MSFTINTSANVTTSTSITVAGAACTSTTIAMTIIAAEVPEQNDFKFKFHVEIVFFRNS